MKNIIALFLALTMAFGGTWAYKANHAIPRSDAAPVNSAEQWWNVSVHDNTTSNEEWTLDPEIPLNYKPVPGQRNMYMVIGNDGKIQEYRIRELQEDGSWLWKTINPDIPENYEPVEGLDDVYKVVDEDGNITYLKYIRNDDDTYAFIEVDENGKPLEDNIPEGDKIPSNYKLIRGNIYAVYNEHGVRIGYKQRIVDEDGNVTWRDVEAKEVQSMTSDNSNSGGNTYEITSPLPSGNNGANGYQENTGESYYVPISGGGYYIEDPGVGIYQPGSNTVTSQNKDGGYTETETLIETKHSGGWKITYQTVVTRIYDAYGTLIQTKSDGPYEISKVIDSTSDGTVSPSDSKSDTLSGEVARVSAYVSFDDSMAGEIVNLLNAERAVAGLPALSVDPSLTSAAKVYAADMAIYNHADYNTATYGTISDLCAYYGIDGFPSQNIWKTSGRSANDVHTRFQTLDSMREARMSAIVSRVGIAVVTKNGTQCVCEVFF